MMVTVKPKLSPKILNLLLLFLNFVNRLEFFSQAQKRIYNQTPQNMGLFIYKNAVLGPELILEDNQFEPFDSTEELDLLSIGVFLVTLLGNSTPENVWFGPLPVYKYPQLRAKAIVRRLNDPLQTDPREKGKSLVATVLLYAAEAEPVEDKAAKMALTRLLQHANSVEEYLNLIQRYDNTVICKLCPEYLALRG